MTWRASGHFGIPRFNLSKTLCLHRYSENKLHFIDKVFQCYGYFRNNTMSTVMGDHSVEIRAKTRIRAGEEITNQYMAPDTPTYIRFVSALAPSAAQGVTKFVCLSNCLWLLYLLSWVSLCISPDKTSQTSSKPSLSSNCLSVQLKTCLYSSSLFLSTLSCTSSS